LVSTGNFFALTRLADKTAKSRGRKGLALCAGLIERLSKLGHATEAELKEVLEALGREIHSTLDLALSAGDVVQGLRQILVTLRRIEPGDRGVGLPPVERLVVDRLTHEVLVQSELCQRLEHGRRYGAKTGAL